MTTEEKLKAFILMRYKSLRAFVNETNVLPYTTVDGMLKRGIANASISNVISLCKALGISADELADGKIVPIDSTSEIRHKITEINDLLNYTRTNIDQYSNLTIDGEPMTRDEIDSLLDAVEIGLGIIKRKRKK